MIALAFTLFAAGVLTILLPCILPLIPIVLGVSIADKNRWRPLLTIVGMVVSFVGFTFLLQVVLDQFVELADVIRIATFYILLLFGLGFTFHTRVPQWIGAVLGGLFFWEKGWIAVLIAIVLGIFAMELGGNVAGRIQQFGSDIQQKTREGLGAQSLLTSFVIGLTMGLVWVPCAGPALGFAFSLVRDQPGFAALLYLTAYGIGAGLPLLLVGYGGQAAVHSVRFLSRYSGRVKEVSGVLLILSAVAFQFNLFRDIQTWLVQNTSYGTLGTDIEESLFGEDMPGVTPTENQSRLPVLRKAPEEFIGGGRWFNGGPRKLADLKGKVVLIDFWTYSCINCIRTLPYVQAYWDKYKSEPFMLIGVHTPEFTFEKSPENVRAAILQHELRYPNVQDNDFKIWNSFNNRYWPAKYLIDAEGYIRYEHFGEGNYDETDKAIASLLAEIGATATGSIVMPSGQQKSYRELTREIYLSSRSRESLGNPSGPPDDDVHTYAAPAPAGLALHRYYLEGDWQLVDDERQVLKSTEGEIRIRALGGEVNLVLGPEKGVKYVKADIEVNGKAMETITIDRHDLYNLYKGPYGEYEVVLKLHGKGVGAYAFTFGQ